MTREEQLKFCSVCKNRKMDMHQGMLCELTNAKADFDGTCPNYDEDAKEKAKNERIEKEYQETLTVSGWLAFFLWVGVGFGAVGSCIFAIASLKDIGLTFTTGIIYILYLVSLLITAILTIKAFYQKAPNAVALAKTYIFMIAIDGVVNIANCIILNDDSMWVDAIRSFIWAAIWFSYISNSTHVENMIPKSTRTWNITEKILIAVYALSCALLVGSLAHFVNNPSDSNFYQKEYVIDATIESANAVLPDYSDPLVTQLKLVKENNNIVYSYNINAMTDTMSDRAAWETALVYKQLMLYTLATSDNLEEDKVIRLFFRGGYNILYRYLNANNHNLYEITLTSDDYLNAKKAGNNFKCDENEFQLLLEYCSQFWPVEYMGDCSLINICHVDSSLSYYIQLPQLSDSELMYIDAEYLANYIYEAWEELNDSPRELAIINNDNIVYHFVTNEGDEHCTLIITPNEYNKLGD
jgi:hypothetical protein